MSGTYSTWNQLLLEDSDVLKVQGLPAVLASNLKRMQLPLQIQLDLSGPVTGTNGVTRTYAPAADYFLEVMIYEGSVERMCVRIEGLEIK
mmetsp:Transcript_67961/g.141689  ORF Transcript_67961/g.141689 Transcript_67961/m.141689 type:complete len:90 (+) Transcript_67961:3-272(+)